LGNHIRREQKALHSMLDSAPIILFHKQMLHDRVTVDAYCWTLIEEFGR
jgi:hypothetical protein